MAGVIVFVVAAIIVVGGALGVVLNANPVRAALCLIAAFFGVAVLFISQEAQFLALVQIVVYAGAIVVLFLFVIMLMNLNADVEPQKNWLVQLAGAISGGILFLVLLSALVTATKTLPEMPQSAPEIGLIKRLGNVLFKDYVLPFEISSVLFLSAMIGAIVIGKKEEEVAG